MNEPDFGSAQQARSFGAPVAGLMTALLWASAFVGIRLALRGFSPLHVALLRYGVASIVLTGYAALIRMPIPLLKDIPLLFGLGMVGIALYNAALNYGQTAVPAATASFLVASAPVWMAVFASIRMGERITSVGWIGIVVSFGGVAVIMSGFGKGVALNIKTLAVLGAAILQSAYSLRQKQLLHRYNPMQITAYAIWGGTLLLLPFGGGIVRELRMAPMESILAVLYMGVMPGALGYLLWSHVLSKTTAALAGSYLYMVPAFALAIAWIGLGEVPSIISAAGGALVIAGVIVVNIRGRMPASRSAPDGSDPRVPKAVHD